MAAVAKVKNEIVPKIMLLPMFIMIATPMTPINSTGSNQDVVVTVRIEKMITSAITIAMATSFTIVSCLDLLLTAEPEKYPSSPTISYILSSASCVDFSELPSSKTTSISAFPSL